MAKLLCQKKEGVAGLWPLIKVDVRLMARRQYGTLFSDADIAAGKDVVLDLGELLPKCFRADRST